MNNIIRAFSRTLRGILDLLINKVFVHVHAGARIAWKDFDEWLVERGWRLRDFLGAVMLYIAVVVGISLAVAVVGIGFGQFGYTNTAQWIVLFGMLVGLVGLLPLALIFLMARGLFDLLLRTGEVCSRLLAKETEENGNIPERLREQLEELRNSSALPIGLDSLFAFYLGLFMAMCFFPMFNIIKYILMGAALGYIYTVWRYKAGIKGWALKHFLFALGMSLMFFASTAWFLTGELLNVKYVKEFFPILQTTNPDELGFYRLVLTALTLIVSLILLYLTTYSKDSVNAMNSGDVQPKGYKKRAVHIHKKEDGTEVVEYEIVRSSGGLKKALILVVFLVGLWFALEQPRSINDIYFDVNQLITIGVLALIFCLFLAMTTGRKSES